MAIRFEQITTARDQERLAEMAHSIWNEYWPPLIGQDQVDYMVERFQSLDAIRRDMAEHAYEYWFIIEDARDAEAGERIIGYTGGHDEPETDRFFISKIYLLKEERGRGIARAVIEFYDRVARERGRSASYLTVNKYNEPAIRSYRKNGFEVIDSVETDIGNGFVMDDYIMQRRCGS